MRFYRPIRDIRAITFDLDDTLYNNEPVIQKADKSLRIFLESNYPETSKLSQTEWFQIKKTVIADNPAFRSDMGELRLRSLEIALARDVEPENVKAAAKACFDHFYDARSDFKVEQSVLDTLSELSKHVPLVAITNGNVDPRKIGIADFFQYHLHASVTRPMKPHRAMFDEASDFLQIVPQHILHVGDNLVKDILGAAQAGYQTAWYACNRTMNINNEPVRVLPNIELSCLDELTALVG